jgi:hypothetical protein
MDPYELKIGGAHLTVRPNEDGTYIIFRGETKLAHLYPDVTSGGTVWETADWIDDEYAAIIGKAIEEHEQHKAFGFF